MENEVKKTKNYFFIQQELNFFDCAEMAELEELAGDACINDYFVAYNRLLLASLKTNGFLFKAPGVPYTPRTLRFLIRFKTGRGASEDEKLLNQLIQDLEKVGLITINKDKTLYFTKFSELVADKATDERNAEQQRLALKVYEQSKELTIEDLEAFTLGVMFKMLCQIGYAAENDYLIFAGILEKLIDTYGTSEVEKAVRSFADRTAESDYSKIDNKENYLYVTLSKIISDEFKDIEITPGIEECLNQIYRHGFIENPEDREAMLSMLLSFKKRGYSDQVIEVTLFKIFHKIDIDPFTLRSRVGFLRTTIEKNIEALNEQMNHLKGGNL